MTRVKAFPKKFAQQSILIIARVIEIIDILINTRQIFEVPFTLDPKTSDHDFSQNKPTQ